MPTTPPLIADLDDRATIEIAGPDWRSFLQGLITQDVETLTSGEIRFGGLLAPQGRLLFDLFLVGRSDGCLIDCAADRRDALVQRLMVYRLRAKVEIELGDQVVQALWRGEADAPWFADPRLPDLGYRGYGLPASANADLASWHAHRLSHGVPGPADWGDDKTYPIEANFDLLNGIDFRKGCFVGQETTSRMKRRGTVKSRMVPITFAGPAPEPGSELLAGDLRAGEVLSGAEGAAMAAVRLDRANAQRRLLPDGRSWDVMWPAWMGANRSAVDRDVQ
jgi:tRNA-modifying protein YgfZ